MTAHAVRAHAPIARIAPTTKEHCTSNRNTIIEGTRAALAADSRIAHAAEVAVAEREGRVTLRGTVRSLHQRQTVVEIAKSMHRVRAVEDGLRIDPRDHTRDNEVRGAAVQALADDGVPARVDLDVSNGWATSRGEVKHQHESDAAFAAVSAIAGVGGITNRIVVSPGADG